MVRANLAALAHDDVGAFNVGTGVETTVNALFDRINTLTEAGATRQHAAAKVGEQRRSCLNVSLAGQELDWQPQVALSDGLTQTVGFFMDKVRG